MTLGKTGETVQVGSQLNEKQLKQLESVILEHLGAFSINGQLGTVKGHVHVIELEPGAKPFAEPLRRRAQVQIEETRRQIKELLKQGIIEDSNSPWASAYVLAQKKNGTWRLCIDFRRLNTMTKKVVYPLPNSEECLDTLSGKKYFSTIDFASGFWQIAMAEDAKEKTAGLVGLGISLERFMRKEIYDEIGRRAMSKALYLDAAKFLGFVRVELS